MHHCYVHRPRQRTMNDLKWPPMIYSNCLNVYSAPVWMINDAYYPHTSYRLVFQFGFGSFLFTICSSWRNAAGSISIRFLFLFLMWRNFICRQFFNYEKKESFKKVNLTTHLCCDEINAFSSKNQFIGWTGNFRAYFLNHFRNTICHLTLSEVDIMFNAINSKGNIINLKKTWTMDARQVITEMWPVIMENQLK